MSFPSYPSLYLVRASGSGCPVSHQKMSCLWELGEISMAIFLEKLIGSFGMLPCAQTQADHPTDGWESLKKKSVRLNFLKSLRSIYLHIKLWHFPLRVIQTDSLEPTCIFFTFCGMLSRSSRYKGLLKRKCFKVIQLLDKNITIARHWWLPPMQRLPEV